MIKKRRKRHGRSYDISCQWFTETYGVEWEGWRSYANEWLELQDKSLDCSLKSVNWFLESYLVHLGMPTKPGLFLQKGTDLPDLLPLIEKKVTSPNEKYRRNNYIVKFLNWVIEKDFSIPNDHGQRIPLYSNSFKIEKITGSYIEHMFSA